MQVSSSVYARALKCGVAFLFSCFYFSPAFAECGQYGCSEVYVDKLEMTAAGGLWIQTSGTETLANCTPNSGVYLYLPAGGNFNAVYAMLLAAQLSDKKVYIRINDGSDPCSVAYVTLARQ